MAQVLRYSPSILDSRHLQEPGQLVRLRHFHKLKINRNLPMCFIQVLIEVLNPSSIPSSLWMEVEGHLLQNVCGNRHRLLCATTFAQHSLTPAKLWSTTNGLWSYDYLLHSLTGTSSKATPLSIFPPYPPGNIPIINPLGSPLDEPGQPPQQLSSSPPSTLTQVPSPTISPIHLTPSPPPPPISAFPHPFPVGFPNPLSFVPDTPAPTKRHSFTPSSMALPLGSLHLLHN
ncbi:hypothetical protein AMTR_s00062p00075830 [Amborella trichopoda]|uniref:Uncharacterized protein n=1 Tax=Amborella trichopoda TaxID=13333 RepID=U5DGK8_AMBTC|nr:hypothetical protein AMTR_s00062p00075830 [Amborella trichopoda]